MPLDTIAPFVQNNIPPELVSLAIVLGGLSGTIFFIWGFIQPVLTKINALLFQLSYREIEIHISDPDYFRFNLWLQQHDQYTYFKRILKVVNSSTSNTQYDDYDDDWQGRGKTVLVPGFGSVLVKAPNKPFIWVTRAKQQSSQVFKQTETLKFRIFSARESTVHELLDSILQIEINGGPQVYVAQSGYWDKAGAPNSVLPPLSQSAVDVVDDVGKFLQCESQYVERGIPFKKGYLLTGPPGTGKSSVVAYIAQHYNIDVYVLGSDSIVKFDQLRSYIKPGSIILIEDIDLTVAGVSRTDLMTAGNTNSDDDDTDNSNQGTNVTFEAFREFLNILDGIVRFNGSIVMVTTNKPQALDPALLRPGRIDQRFELGAYTTDEQIKHINRFYGLTLDPQQYSNIQTRTVAEVQLLCVTYMNDPDTAIAKL